MNLQIQCTEMNLSIRAYKLYAQRTTQYIIVYFICCDIEIWQRQRQRHQPHSKERITQWEKDTRAFEYYIPLEYV